MFDKWEWIKFVLVCIAGAIGAWVFFGYWAIGILGVVTLFALVVVPVAVWLARRNKLSPGHVNDFMGLVGAIGAMIILRNSYDEPPSFIKPADLEPYVTFTTLVTLYFTACVVYRVAEMVLRFIPRFHPKNWPHLASGALEGSIGFCNLALIASAAYIMFEYTKLYSSHLLLDACIVPLGFAIAVFIIPVEISSFLLNLSETRFFRRMFRSGQGGSARWSGPHSFKKFSITRDGFIEALKSKLKDHPKKLSGRIFLGRPLFEDSSIPGYLAAKDDVHMITIGMSGAGKSKRVLFNNLPFYDGDVMALDPKGELANYAAASRAARGSDVYILDPYGLSNALNDYSAAYNPLIDIDLNELGVMRFVAGLSEACVIREGDKNLHFTETARNFVEGLIAHVLSTYPPSKHNLPAIYDLLMGIGDPTDPSAHSNAMANFKKLIEDMTNNTAAGGLPVQGAKLVRDAGSEGYGSLLSTVQRSLKWTSDPAMRKQLAPGPNDRQLSLRNLGAGQDISIFIVLPFDFMEMGRQARWLRTLVNIGISCVQIQPKAPDPSVLFIVDEFYSLGRFEKIESSIVQMRSAGIKLWMFNQQISQLQSLYKENWPVFIGSSTTQVLALNDPEGLEWISKRLGGQRGGAPLMTAPELSEFLGKDSGNQIVFPVDGLPMRLEAPYYEYVIPKRFYGKADDPHTIKTAAVVICAIALLIIGFQFLPSGSPDKQQKTANSTAQKPEIKAEAITTKGQSYNGPIWINKNGQWLTNPKPSGVTYIGQIDPNNRPHGQGTLRYDTGEFYTGNFSTGFFSGIGTFEWSNNRKYKGKWRRGKPQGFGKFTDKDGGNTVGEWRAGCLTIAKGKIFTIFTSRESCITAAGANKEPQSWFHTAPP